MQEQILLSLDYNKKNMLSKSKVIETIETLEDKFSLDELIEKIYFMEKVQEGIEQSEKGQVMSEEDFDKKTAQWFK